MHPEQLILFALAVSAAITLLICAGAIWFLSRQLTERTKLAADLTSAADADRQRLAEVLLNESTVVLTKATRVAERLTLEYEDNPLTRELQDDLALLAVQLRHVMHELHPPALATDGLVVAFDQLVETFHKQTGIDTWFHEKADPAGLSESQKIGLYRIAQDALREVRNKGKATRVEVALKRVSGQFILTVSDNGDDGKSKQVAQTIKDKAALLNAFVDSVPADDIENGHSVRVRITV